MECDVSSFHDSKVSPKKMSQDSSSGSGIESRLSSNKTRRASLEPASDADAASFCSSPSSFKVRLRNTFLDFKEDGECPLADVESPRADSIHADSSAAVSPLRRSQSDCTGVDCYIRQRLGSNGDILCDSVAVDGDCFSPAGRLSPMSSLVHRVQAPTAGSNAAVSILSFSPPTFQQSPFVDTTAANACSDFVMVMEEDPPAPRIRPQPMSSAVSSVCNTQPATPTPVVTPVMGGSYAQTEGGFHEKTTVMLRNIPNKYTQRMLLDQLSALGYEGKYDFFYLPIDFRNRCNVGYAFINFTSGDAAVEFKDHLHGYRLTGFNSQKICEVSYARVQGLKANIQHYRNSPVNGIAIPEYRPLLFAHGTEIQFPFVNKQGGHA